VDLLDRALADRRITMDEANALYATAETWGLTREQVIGAHQNYLEALAAAALADGIVTTTERRDLNDVARLLGIPLGTLEALMAKTEHRAGRARCKVIREPRRRGRCRPKSLGPSDSG
jgi:DNA polymerase III subunit epsilon